MKIAMPYLYELVAFMWIGACFLVLLLKVPHDLRRRSVKEIAAVTSIFVIIAAIVLVFNSDAPRVNDWLAKLIGKWLGG